MFECCTRREDERLAHCPHGRHGQDKEVRELLTANSDHCTRGLSRCTARTGERERESGNESPRTNITNTSIENAQLTGDDTTDVLANKGGGIDCRRTTEKCAHAINDAGR